MRLSSITSIISISQSGAEFSIVLANPDADKLTQDLYYLDNHGYLAKAPSDEEGRISGVPESYREGIDTSVSVKSSVYRLNKVAKAMAEASSEDKHLAYDSARAAAKYLMLQERLISFFRPCNRYEFLPVWPKKDLKETLISRASITIGRTAFS